jgi:hypothetical protein
MSFWGSLKADFKAFWGHWLRLIGFIVSYFAPMVIFAIAYGVDKKDGIGSLMPLGFWLVAVPLLTVYWFKAKKALGLKIAMMKTANEIDVGRHYAMIVLAEILKLIMSLLTLLALWAFLKMSEDLFGKASEAVMTIGICEAVGGVLVVLDAVFTRGAKSVPIKPEK